MSISKEDKEKIIQAAKKLVQDKKDIIRYSKGELTKKQLNDKGIKLTMPL